MADEPGLEPEDDALIRIVRAAQSQEPRGPEPEIPADLLYSYVLGDVDDTQRKRVWQALARSKRLRREVLELQRSIAALSEPDARADFDAAQPPPLDRFPKLQALRESFSGQRFAFPWQRARSRGRGWSVWSWGGWATATAACVLLVAWPRGVGNRGDSPSTGIDLSLGGPSVSASLHTTRGSDDNLVSVTSATRMIELQVQPPELPEDARVRVTMEPSGGGRPWMSEHTVTEFYGGRRLILRSSTPFPPGRYRLTLSSVPPAPESSVSYDFEIVLREP